MEIRKEKKKQNNKRTEAIPTWSQEYISNSVEKAKREIRPTSLDLSMEKVDIPKARFRAVGSRHWEAFMWGKKKGVKHPRLHGVIDVRILWE